MSVLLIAGSPGSPSRSSHLLDAVGRKLEDRGVVVDRIAVRDLPAQALLHADTTHPVLAAAIAKVAAASGLVVATPVYKAAYSGALKMFLDLLSQNALAGKTVLPIATGGSSNHMLAVDYALRPVLQALGPRHTLPGVYATDAQVILTPEGACLIDTDVQRRLDDAVEKLASALPGVSSRSVGSFESIAFDQVRCSV